MAPINVYSPARGRAALLTSLVLATGLLLPVGSARAAAPTPVNLTSVHFVSTTAGWGLGGSSLLRTADGGLTWHVVTPAGMASRAPFPPAVAYLDATHAWIADGAPSDTPGIFRTTDGGHSWKKSVLPAPAQSAGPIIIGQIDFVDAAHGWALEDLGGGAGTFYFRLLRTTDGGAHWSQVAGGLPGPLTKGAYPTNVQGISFDSTASGWTSTVVYAGPQESGLYHTMDAGRTWRKVNLPMTGAFSSGFFGVQTPTFFDSRHGVTAVSSDTAVGAYITSDGGVTWTLTTPLMVKPILSAAHPFATDFADAQHAWLIVGAHFYFSADLGRHWSPVRQSLGFGQIGAFDYLNAQSGWALGGTQADNGGVHSTLRYTVDAGHSWKVLHPVIA